MLARNVRQRHDLVAVKMKKEKVVVYKTDISKKNLRTFSFFANGTLFSLFLFAKIPAMSVWRSPNVAREALKN